MNAFLGVLAFLVFGNIVSWYGMSPNPRKVQVLTNMAPPKSKKELLSFLGILNYLSKFSPMIAKVCGPLTLTKAEWSLNRMSQDLYERAGK